MTVDIDKAATEKATDVAASVRQDLVVGDAQGSLKVMERPLEIIPAEGVVVEVKIPLQTMGPLPAVGSVIKTPSSSSRTLDMVLSLPEAGAPGPSLATDAEHAE